MASGPAMDAPANGTPECGGPDCEEPEPSGPDAGIRQGERPQQVDVDVLWDEAITNRQSAIGLSDDRIVEAIRSAAMVRGFRSGQIGVRVTDDAAIHEINVRHLGHDYPTDVISFPYSDDEDWIEGELVVSVDTAEQHASAADWSWENELLLYMIHGTLHIAGMDDHDEGDRAEMREAERRVLRMLGIDAEPKVEGDQHG